MILKILLVFKQRADCWQFLFPALTGRDEKIVFDHFLLVRQAAAEFEPFIQGTLTEEEVSVQLTF
jgi:hypothetical protein